MRGPLAGDLRAAGLGPVEVEELTAGLVGALVSVGSEEVALGLQEVRRQRRRAVAVVVRERRAERGDRDAAKRGFGDHATPVALGALDFAVEKLVQQQVGQQAVTSPVGARLYQGRSKTSTQRRASDGKAAAKAVRTATKPGHNGKQVNRVEQAREEAAALRGLLRKSEEEVKAPRLQGFH